MRRVAAAEEAEGQPVCEEGGEGQSDEGGPRDEVEGVKEVIVGQVCQVRESKAIEV